MKNAKETFPEITHACEESTLADPFDVRRVIVKFPVNEIGNEKVVTPNNETSQLNISVQSNISDTDQSSSTIQVIANNINCEGVSPLDESMQLNICPLETSTVQTDAVWNHKKVEAWSEITTLYNLQQTSGIRIDTQLKNLYDTLKRDARKEKSNKVQMYKTGGGSNNNHVSKTTEKVIGLLGDQMDPLFNSADSDANYNDERFEVVNIFSEDNTNLQDSTNMFQNSDILCEPVTPESISFNKTFSSLSQPYLSSTSTPSISIASTSSPSNKSIYNSSIKSNNNFEIESKQISSKRVYDGLTTLNNKRLTKTDNSAKFEEEIYSYKIKKSKIDIEISELERTLMIQNIKYDKEKFESEVRQNKIREEILLTELMHKKKMFGIE
ncbi:hypothetical protein ACI65C_004507 [Semiaphis heraclei]